jgi:HEAT repeat protein
MVAGSARDRLCDLALDLGLVHQWYDECRAHGLVRRRAAFTNLAFASFYEPCRRVAGDLLLRATKDSDPDVRLSACRGVVLFRDKEQIEYLFALAIRANVLTRIVLTEDLRRHATSLAAGPVREALRSGDAAHIRATLEILVAWARAIPLDELGEFLDHRDRDIRILAFRLASFVPVNDESRLALLRSLRDVDTEVRGLAVIAVGRQKITEAIPELSLCVEREGLEQARQAAAALAAMPPEGWRSLEELGSSPNPATALAAAEALARARKGA